MARKLSDQILIAYARHFLKARNDLRKYGSAQISLYPSQLKDFLPESILYPEFENTLLSLYKRNLLILKVDRIETRDGVTFDIHSIDGVTNKGLSLYRGLTK